MPKKLQVYRCEVCGNIIQILHAGVGTIVCCKKSMKLLEEKTEDSGKEKHVPVLEKTENGINVSVGTIPHPMVESHYIEWIEIIDGENVYRKHLNPGDGPNAYFKIKTDNPLVREYCLIHGFWRN